MYMGSCTTEGQVCNDCTASYPATPHPRLHKKLSLSFLIHGVTIRDLTIAITSVTFNIRSYVGGQLGR